jgi:uncharacterized repeat protein (TIGR02543 family)
MTTRRIVIILIVLLSVLMSCNQNSGVSCTVYFSPNGGIGNAPEKMTGQAGSTIILPDAGNLTRAHYKFSGWNTSMAGTGRNFEPGGEYGITFSTTLYANWQPEKFILSFDPNGAEGKPADVAVPYETPVALPDSSSMLYPHMDFNGWSDGTVIYEQGIAYPVLGNTKLVAQWSDHIYTVTFDANGGKITAPPVSAIFGDVIDLPTYLYRQGFVLVGWGLSPAGDAIENPMTVTGDVTLYAIWSQEAE